jgi:hypothetical protein
MTPLDIDTNITDEILFVGGRDAPLPDLLDGASSTV